VITSVNLDSGTDTSERIKGQMERWVDQYPDLGRAEIWDDPSIGSAYRMASNTVPRGTTPSPSPRLFHVVVVRGYGLAGAVVARMLSKIWVPVTLDNGKWLG